MLARFRRNHRAHLLGRADVVPRSEQPAVRPHECREVEVEEIGDLLRRSGEGHQLRAPSEFNNRITVNVVFDLCVSCAAPDQGQISEPLQTLFPLLIPRPVTVPAVLREIVFSR